MARHGRERRRHERHGLKCPAVVIHSDGREITRTRSADLSDGGVLLPLPAEAAPEPGQKVRVVLSIPRKTPNTFMLEQVPADARVLRHEPMNDSIAAVAMEFTRPLALKLRGDA